MAAANAARLALAGGSAARRFGGGEAPARSAALCGGKSYVISDNDVLLQLAKARGLLDGAKSTETRPPCNDQSCKSEGLIMRDVARCAEDILAYLLSSNGDTLQAASFYSCPSSTYRSIRDGSLKEKVMQKFTLPGQPDTQTEALYRKKGEKQSWSMGIYEDGFKNSKGEVLTQTRTLAIAQAIFECTRAAMGVPSYIFSSQYKDRKPLMSETAGGGFISYGDGSAYYMWLSDIFQLEGWGERRETALWGHLLCCKQTQSSSQSASAVKLEGDSFYKMGKAELAMRRRGKEASDVGSEDAGAVATHIGGGEYGEDVQPIFTDTDKKRTFKIDNADFFFRGVFIREGIKEEGARFVTSESAAFSESAAEFTTVPQRKKVSTKPVFEYKALMDAELMPRGAMCVPAPGDQHKPLRLSENCLPPIPCAECGQYAEIAIAGHVMFRYRQRSGVEGGFGYTTALEKYLKSAPTGDATTTNAVQMMLQSSKDFEQHSKTMTALMEAQRNRDELLKSAEGRARTHIATVDAEDPAQRQTFQMQDRDLHSLLLGSTTQTDFAAAQIMDQLMGTVPDQDTAARLMKRYNRALQKERRRNGLDSADNAALQSMAQHTPATMLVLGTTDDSPVFDAFKSKDAKHCIAVSLPSGQILRLNVKELLYYGKGASRLFEVATLFADFFGSKSGKQGFFKAAQSAFEAASDETERDEIAEFIIKTITCQVTKGGRDCRFAVDRDGEYLPVSSMDGEKLKKKFEKLADSIRDGRKQVKLEQEVDVAALKDMVDKLVKAAGNGKPRSSNDEDEPAF